MDILQLETPPVTQPRGRDVLDIGIAALLFIYLVANRLIPDVLVLPVGISVHPSEAILALLALCLVVRQVVDPRALPSGPLAAASLFLLLLLSFAPLLNASTLTPSEIRNFDQGVVAPFLFGALLVAAYQYGYHNKSRRLVLLNTLALSVAQAAIAIAEGVTGRTATWVADFWKRLGLQGDSGLTRTITEDLNVRLTGELRASSTAPHPLILSTIMAISILICADGFLRAETRNSRALFAISSLICTGGLAFANSRTGILVLVVGIPILIVSHLGRPTDLLLLTLLGMIAVVPVAVSSPATLRIALDTLTFVERDHNLDVRIERISRILDYLEERPILGAGLYTNDATIRQLWDNAYLHALSELGMLGLAALLVFFLMLCLGSYRCLRSPDSILKQLGFAGLIGALTLLVAGLTLDVWTFDQYVPIALVLSALAIGSVDAQASRRECYAKIDKA